MKYPASNNGQVGEQVNYAYHTQMSLNTLLSGFPYAYVSSTSYDEAGRVKQRTLDDSQTQEPKFQSFGYDRLYQLTRAGASKVGEELS